MVDTILNPLPSSKRERNRYLVFELISESGTKFDMGSVSKAVWGAVLDYLGELGASKTSLRMVDWDTKTQKGTIKVSHKSVAAVRAALALVKEIEKKAVMFHVKTVSGILKKARARI